MLTALTKTDATPEFYCTTLLCNFITRHSCSVQLHINKPTRLLVALMTILSQ